MSGWHEAARHFWHGRKLAREQEIRLKQRLWAERVERIALANTLADLLLDIAYDEDDINHEYCNVCHRSLIEEDGHQSGCALILGLAVITQAQTRAG